MKHRKTTFHQHKWQLQDYGQRQQCQNTIQEINYYSHSHSTECWAGQKESYLHYVFMNAQEQMCFPLWNKTRTVSQQSYEIEQTQS